MNKLANLPVTMATYLLTTGARHAFKCVYARKVTAYYNIPNRASCEALRPLEVPPVPSFFLPAILPPSPLRLQNYVTNGTSMCLPSSPSLPSFSSFPSLISVPSFQSFPSFQGFTSLHSLLVRPVSPVCVVTPVSPASPVSSVTLVSPFCKVIPVY